MKEWGLCLTLNGGRKIAIGKGPKKERKRQTERETDMHFFSSGREGSNLRKFD